MDNNLTMLFIVEFDIVVQSNLMQVFELLPSAFKQQLLLDRDPHGKCSSG